MQTQQPGYVTINDRRVKVQQWNLEHDRVVLTTLVRGDASGADLLDQMQNETIMLQWDDSPALAVRPEITHHRAVGSGPATVHRIEVVLWLPESTAVVTDESIDAKLERILLELQLLRAEVAELRGIRRTGTSAIAAPLAAGRTLLDFEIEADENE